MKVKIGPHTNWWGPYQIAQLLRHVGVNDDRCHEYGKWLAGTWVNTVCEWIHSKKKRTVKIKIDRYDTWNMDGTLALIILPMLKQLKETKHGSPGGMPAFAQTSNSAQLSFDFYEDGDEEAWNEGHRQWGVILDEMIWTFEQLQPDCNWEDQYWITHPELDFDDYPEDEGKESIPVRWKVEGECDRDARAKHEQRIADGLKLFGSHFMNLWD